uniref:Uncharacterized protein n=1 Tax=Anguilla anguilla TaxID=7936 RepID=A0A0E9QRW3_ANGAN
MWLNITMSDDMLVV